MMTFTVGLIVGGVVGACISLILLAIVTAPTREDLRERDYRQYWAGFHAGRKHRALKRQDKGVDDKGIDDEPS
jgi:hypothetical protein